MRALWGAAKEFLKRKTPNIKRIRITEPVEKLMRRPCHPIWMATMRRTRKYKTTYRDLVTKLKDELKSTKAVLSTTDDELKKVAKEFEALQTKQENRWKDDLAEIKKGNAMTLKASS